jgi:hypothetical protein
MRAGSLVLATALALGACSSGTSGEEVADPTEAASTTAAPVDIWSFEPFSDLGSGRYFIDPDLDPSTPLRVTYEIPVEGWKMWIGGAKFSDAGHVGFSITTVSNLVTDGCLDHSWQDPPVGPSVEDLATALAHLAPFHVTSPPEPVSIYGYDGMHLGLTVPHRSSWKRGAFVGCEERKLKSWVGVAARDDEEPGDAYYGYTGPGYTEEFWILDVDGTRLMIAAEHSRGTPPGDLEELSRILDSIRIEP